MLRRSLFALVVSLIAVSAAADGRYSADRYDSRVEILDGGTARVSEIIALRFESGTFTQFYRAIPKRMTDGIEIVSASMDGTPLQAGEGTGHIQLSGSSNLRVTWRFEPTSNSVHTFALVYLVHGLIRQEADADVLEWTVLPTEHQYQIASSTADLSLPAQPIAPPRLERRRVDEPSLDVGDGHVRITAERIPGNGWFRASVRLPRGSAIDAPPSWQRHQVDIRQMSPTWITAAVVVLAAGLVLLFFVRQQYDPPAIDYSSNERRTAPPDSVAPVIAGAVLGNGSLRLEHAMAALVSLADRGELRIDEQRRMLGQRNFAISRTTTRHALAPYEETLLEIIFAGEASRQSVSLGKARSRLMRQFRKFKAAVEPAMQAAGLLDDGRRGVRRLFARIAFTSMIVAGIVAILLSLVVQRLGPWPMLVPLALAIVGVTSLICFAAHTPLSNVGIQRAREWRAFRRYLRDVARDREAAPSDAVVRQLLPLALALGLAQSWASYLKKHRSAAPDWFRAVSATASDSAIAFSTFVASGGAHPGAGHGGAGAAAGGGASGAS
jgi:hypothetical protein